MSPTPVLPNKDERDHRQLTTHTIDSLYLLALNTNISQLEYHYLFKRCVFQLLRFLWPPPTDLFYLFQGIQVHYGRHSSL